LAWRTCGFGFCLPWKAPRVQAARDVRWTCSTRLPKPSTCGRFRTFGTGSVWRSCGRRSPTSCWACRRILYIADTAGLVLAGLAAFSVSSLAILGWVYDAEFAQAVFCLAFPMVFVGWLTVRSARSIAARDLRGEDLYRALFRHRLACQGIGMVAILGTTMWGMWVNLAMSSAFGF
jgi:hypothetical protein